MPDAYAPLPYSAMLEAVAAELHSIWVTWSSDVVNNKVSASYDVSMLLDAWQHLWIPYAQLTDPQKQKDRVWARRILEASAKAMGEGQLK